MQAYLLEGLPAAEAARAALNGDASTSLGYLAGPRLTESAGSEPSAGLRQAPDAFDEPAAQAILDWLLADLSLPAVLRDVVLPYLADLGDRCQGGTASVAMEHFASNVIRGRPAGLPVAGGAGTGHRPCSPAHPASCTIWRSWFSASCSTGTAGGSTISGQAPRSRSWSGPSAPRVLTWSSSPPPSGDPRAAPPAARRPRPARPARPRRSRRHGADRDRGAGPAAGGRPSDRGRAGRVATVKVLVAGASGFVGRRLCPALAGAGRRRRRHDPQPRRLRRNRHTRPRRRSRPRHRGHRDGRLPGGLLPRALTRRRGLRTQRRSRRGGIRAGGGAGRAARIIYLGGLGDDKDALSAHLRSRREAEQLLGSAAVPVTVIRAGIIVGHGGISWELTRQLVEHLPAMVTPRWVTTCACREPCPRHATR